MSTDEVTWSRLAEGAGTAGISSLRLHPDSEPDLTLALQNPGNRRMLVLKLSRPAAAHAIRTLRDLPQTRGMELQFAAAGGGRHELQLILDDTELASVFNVLVDDIAGYTAGEPDDTRVVTTFVRRFSSWVELLSAVSAGGLGPGPRRGLVGELLLLSRLLSAGTDSAAAVSGWTGPLRANQDFQLLDASIEVKTTTARQPHSIPIASERQLDPIGQRRLFLVHLVLDERRGGDGSSLNHIVGEVRGELNNDKARARFDELLINVGYLPAQRPLYDEPRYSTRDVHYYALHGDYPRVVESDLRLGVGDCSYMLSVAALQPWEVDGDELDRAVASDGAEYLEISNLDAAKGEAS